MTQLTIYKTVAVTRHIFIVYKVMKMLHAFCSLFVVLMVTGHHFEEDVLDQLTQSRFIRSLSSGDYGKLVPCTF